jgi:hypothetical protein
MRTHCIWIWDFVEGTKSNYLLIILTNQLHYFINKFKVPQRLKANRDLVIAQALSRRIPLQQPGSSPRSGYVIFVVDKVMLGKVPV